MDAPGPPRPPIHSSTPPARSRPANRPDIASRTDAQRRWPVSSPRWLALGSLPQAEFSLKLRSLVPLFDRPRPTAPGAAVRSTSCRAQAAQRPMGSNSLARSPRGHVRSVRGRARSPKRQLLLPCTCSNEHVPLPNDCKMSGKIQSSQPTTFNQLTNNESIMNQ
jgi:hypothetical protein